jgi:amino acid transporter
MSANDASGVERFGYRQELKRSLPLVDLVVYGLIFIGPIAPFGVFGFVYNASHGMVPLVYVVGTLAMLFTASSYITMSRLYPLAGSVYSYAGRAIGAGAGFVAGWVMLLDYLLLPAVGYVAVAVAFHSVIPAVPRTAWIVFGIAFSTFVNFLGIEATARANRVLFGVQLAILAGFIVAAYAGVGNGTAGARWSIAPLFQPAVLEPSLVFGALSLAALSFLGFDAISTLAEEATGTSKTVGHAILLSLCAAGVLFVTQTYFASLFVLGQREFASGDATDGALYGIAATIGGPSLQFLVSIPAAGIATIAGCVAAQAATSRLLFGMARDGRLPRSLAHVHPRRKTPERAILLIAAVNIVVGVALGYRLELLTSMVNFGALTGFLLLHVAVIAHFLRDRSPGGWLRHFIVPAIGFAIVGYVLLNMSTAAKLVGGAWLAIGIAVLLGLKVRDARASRAAAGELPERNT